SFFDGARLLGTSPVLGGTATLSTPAPGLGLHSITAAYSGDAARFPSLSAPLSLRVASNRMPAIESLADVPGDQGGALALRFRASRLDFPGPGSTIARYDVLRGSSGEWSTVATVAAAHDSAYGVLVPTSADSNASGLHTATFLVRAVSLAPPAQY